MSSLPTDIAQQALDAAGIDYLLGDIEGGSREGQVLNRAYGQCLRQLLRGANWDFARRTTSLVMLADATGNTPNVGTNVIIPYIYEYAVPNDYLKARFVPWNWYQNPGSIPGNIQVANPASPLMTGLGSFPYMGQRLTPARFLVANDPNYPPTPGTNPDDMPQGVSPVGQTVICTNVKDAQLIYTGLMIYPSVWDPLFRAAFVAYLAQEICLPLHKDKKLGMALRDSQIKIAKAKLQEARRVDGDEGVYSSSIPVAFMQARMNGGTRNVWWNNCGDGAGPGTWGGGSFDACGFADGTAY